MFDVDDDTAAPAVAPPLPRSSSPSHSIEMSSIRSSNGAVSSPTKDRRAAAAAAANDIKMEESTPTSTRPSNQHASTVNVPILSPPKNHQNPVSVSIPAPSPSHSLPPVASPVITAPAEPDFFSDMAPVTISVTRVAAKPAPVTASITVPSVDEPRRSSKFDLDDDMSTFHGSNDLDLDIDLDLDDDNTKPKAAAKKKKEKKALTVDHAEDIDIDFDIDL